MTEGLVWLNAVIDLPAEHFDTAGDFWAELSGSTKGDVHPDHDEFVHLNPAVGEMYLELQRIDAGPAGVHLDLVVTDIPQWASRAVDCGATVVAEPGHVVLQSPAGVTFCVVPASRSWAEPPRFPDAAPRVVEQVTIDGAGPDFGAEVSFWSQLTGWAVGPVYVDDYRALDVPAHFPFGIALQRLGPDDQIGARSHLDLVATPTLDAATQHLVALGAAVEAERVDWHVLRDPAGLTYCIAEPH